MNKTTEDYHNKDDYHNKKWTTSFPMDKPEDIYTAKPEETSMLSKPPISAVGSYCLGGESGLRIYLVKKPKWLHRKMMNLCLGWEWIDNSK